MLSNETAVGKFPVEAVATMARIAVRMEREGIRGNIRNVEDIGRSIPNGISQAVSQISEQLNAAAIMTLTKTGATARNVSKFRPKTAILAVTPHVDVARQLQLVWGVRPLLVLDLPSTGQTFQSAMTVAQEKELVSDGDLVVMTAGTLQGVAGSTDLIKVEVVTAVLGRGTGVGLGSVSGMARVARTAADVGNFHPGEILVVEAHQRRFCGDDSESSRCGDRGGQFDFSRRDYRFAVRRAGDGGRAECDAGYSGRNYADAGYAAGFGLFRGERW